MKLNLDPARQPVLDLEKAKTLDQSQLLNNREASKEPPKTAAAPDPSLVKKVIVSVALIAGLVVGGSMIMDKVPSQAVQVSAPPVAQATPVTQPSQVVISGSEVEQGNGMWGIVTATAVVETEDLRIGSNQQGLVNTPKLQPGCRVVSLQTPASSWVTSMGGLIGDVIVSYDGKPVTSIMAVNAIHASHKPLDEVSVEVIRSGVLVQLSGKLGSCNVRGALP